MQSWATLLADPEPHSHLLQLYGHDTQLLTWNVSQYLGEGLGRGEGLLAITTVEHSCAFARELRHQCSYQEAVREGRLIFLDAEVMLARLMVDGLPDWDRMEAVVGSLLGELQHRVAGAGLRVYGEMVGLLWEKGRFAAAIQLENHWNRLLQRYSFSLLCGYPTDRTADDLPADSMNALLRAHAHLLPTRRDLEDAGDLLTSAADRLRLQRVGHGLKQNLG